jgi:hypothetical protein
VIIVFIHIQHPEFRGVELAGHSLFYHTCGGERELLHGDITDLVVTVSGGEVHIVAFLEDKDYAWYFRGERAFQRDRLELGQLYGGAARLIVDGEGSCHLLYLLKQSAGRSALLKHLNLADQHKSPLSVSPNVSPLRSSLSGAWHRDGYLHVVYCSNRDQHLYYRAFEPRLGVWSGAIPFSHSRCSYPQLISSDKLYLFWQEEGELLKLLVKVKTEVWSEPLQLGSGQSHTSGFGFSLEDGWNIIWREQDQLFQAGFDSWKDFQAVDAGQYEYLWEVVGGTTIPRYRLKGAEEPVESAGEVDREAEAAPPTPEIETAGEKEQREKAKREAEAQAAFMRQAFQVLQEWETLREEIRRWRRETHVPEPVDLSSVLNRLDRLERRFVTIDQSQRRGGEKLQGELEEIRRQLAQSQRRLQNLEQAQKGRDGGFWHRLFKRQ